MSGYFFTNLVNKSLYSTNDTDNFLYKDPSNKILWTDKDVMCIQRNLRTPSEDLYDFINYSYLQLLKL